MNKSSFSAVLLVTIIGSLCANAILFMWAWPTIKQTFPTWFGDPVVEVQSYNRKPPTVITEIVQKGPITMNRSFSGTLKAINSVPLASEVDGKVEQIFFKEGVEVKKGQILVKLDDRQAKAIYNEAIAKLKQTKSQYKRMKALTDKNYNSVAATEKALAEWKIAEAELDKAKFNLENTLIKAPFDGFMGFRSMANNRSGSDVQHNISVGTFISRHQEVATIIALDPMEVLFTVPEQDMARINIDQEIEVTVDGVSDLPTEAKISAIEPYSDPVSHGIRVKASLSNSKKDLKPGMFATVNLLLANRDKAIVVKASSIVREGDRNTVFVVVDGRARQKTVVLGARDGEKIEIIDGLKERELYIVDGSGLLSDGRPVKIKGQDDKEEKANNNRKKV